MLQPKSLSFVARVYVAANSLEKAEKGSAADVDTHAEVVSLAATDVLHSLNNTVCVCSAAAALAKKLNVECPIIDGIFRVIHDKAEPLGVSSCCMSSHVATFLLPCILSH